MQKPQVTLEMSLCSRNPDRIEAVYVRFLKATVAKTIELVPNTLYADMDSQGAVIGLELLGPISLELLTQKPLNFDPDRSRVVAQTLQKRAPEFIRAA